MKIILKSPWRLLRLLLVVPFIFFTVAGSAQTTTTLNPVADTDTQSDVPAGTNTTLNASQFNYFFLKFSLSSISGSITSAKLRVYTNPSAGTTLNVNNASPDSWTEGSAKPTLGTLIIASSLSTGAGYKEIDVTSRVVTEAAGDDLISFGLTTNLGTWTGFNSRENASNKPQLVIITSGGGGDTQAPTVPAGLAASAVSQTSFTLSWNASTDNTAVTGYEIFRNGSSIGTSATTNFPVTGLTASTTYSMTVRARDAVPNWSAQSSPLPVTTSASSGSSKLNGTVIGTTGSWNNSGNTRDKVFDNNTTTYFDAPDASASTAWAGLDLSSTFQITSVRYYPRADNAARMNGGKFQGSNTADFSSGVVDLYLINAAPPYAWTQQTVSNPGSFRYVRYLAPANSWGNVAEVEFYGSGGTPANNLQVSPTSLNVGSAASSNNVAVTSNVSWTATDNQTWISVTPGSGSNNGNVSVAITANTGAQRTGTVTISGGSITRSIAVTQAAAGSTGGAVTIGTNFWRVDWGNGWNDYYNSGINWASVTNPWRADFIADITPYSVLRFMDWGPTNGSDFVNWSSRIAKTANHYTLTVPLDNGANSGRGVAYEWQIDLCNRTGNDIWLNIPHKASDDYIRQLARLVRDNLTNNKKVYVEYSNEVWNWGFSQTNYADVQGQALNLFGSFPFKGKTVFINAWWGYYIYRSCQMAKIFDEEFAGQTSRLVKVLGGQLGYDNWPDLVNAWGDVHPVVLQHMAALAQPSINPNAVSFDQYALAPYWNGNDLAGMLASLPYMEEKFDEARRTLNDHAPGMKLVCYEAGQDGGNQVANAQNAGIYNVYIEALNRIGAKIQGPLVHYTHVGWDANHAWGAKQNTSATLAASHKYRALIDWINSHGAGRSANPETVTAVDPSKEKAMVESGNQELLKVFPNPISSSVLRTIVYSEKTEKATMRIVSPGSKTLRSMQVGLQKGPNYVNLPVQQLSNGVYYLVVDKATDEKLVKKIVIQR